MITDELPGSQPKTISVIIPTLNEEQNIPHLVARLHSALAGKFLAFEFIFVDDHSTDNTLKALMLEMEKYPVRIFIKQGRPGKAFSLLEGFAHAQYDLIAILDADLQYPPEAIPQMANKILAGSDVVVGRRVERQVSVARKISSKGFAFFFGRLLHGLKVDVQSGLKVFKRELIEHLNFSPSPWTFDLEFLIQARDMGGVIDSVDIPFDNRAAGNSKITSIAKASWEIGLNALKLKFKRQQPHTFSKDITAAKGEGFFHNGKPFVTHSVLSNKKSAFFNLINGQKLFLAALIIILIEGLVFNWHGTLLILLSGLTIMYFMDLLFNFYLIFVSFKREPEIKISDEELKANENRIWPVYTILCPLYKEWQVLPQFAQAIKNIAYPKNRLQVMLLLEEDDVETIQRARSFDLPENFEINVVPHSLPKTKPKAMNYGLKSALGEYIVVYDAEDMPDPKQLKKAVLAFERLDKKTLCVQAKLNYYNPRQNLLTRMFTAEYSLWFDLILPGLQSINAPIPLGGTSNHFKAEALKSLYGWDAFNVTEDCDLGLRLAKQGYRTAIIDSTTLEEANSKPLNWFRQRSRWIKGYLQTYFVHMRDPWEFLNGRDPSQLLAFQLVVGGKILSLFINPLMWVITLCYFLFRAKVGLFVESFFPTPILYIGVASFIFGNFLYLYYYMIGCVKRGYYDLVKYSLLIPFYWLAMSFAALKAGYEVIIKPHYWAKTVHGLHLKKQEAKFLEKDIGNLTPLAAPSFYAKFKTLLSGNLGGGGFYVVAILAANFLNFLFNALLGRTLTLEDFGTVTLFNTILALLTVVLGSLSSTVNYKTAFLTGKNQNADTVSFTQRTQKIILFAASAVSLLWILMVPKFADFFKIPNLSLILMFTPVLALGSIAAVQTGFLMGRFQFNYLGRSTIYEALTKLAIALVFVYIGLHSWASVSVPGSIIVSYSVTQWYVWRVLKKDSSLKNESPAQAPDVRFPASYFWAAMTINIASAAFLNIDVLLAKHYFSPSVAGAYALLSLVGKMVYLLGSLLSVFITSIISRHLGAGTNGRKDFYRLFNGTVVCTALAFLGAGVFGKYTIPLLLGHSSLSILPFLFNYCLAMALLTLAGTVINYHLAKREYSFAGITFASAAVLVVGIIKYHSGIEALTTVMLVSAGINFILVFGWHAVRKNSRFILRNISDMLDVFMPLPQAPSLSGGQRILIFNWRDTKHAFAGGAETYIHELSKRWAASGNEVTLFCGNDGKNLRNELVDGVRVVRRGGFYFVYIWAFLYYIVKFRGRYDIIIDSQNGIPFFTPLYAKEPVYCLMHHVHQGIFQKYLIWPLAKLASFLEKSVMPFTYRNTKFITVSNSSLNDMRKLGLGSAGIDVIFPGVDLEILKPGQRHQNPLILYLGRLKAYKSVDVLINSFKNILARTPDARLAIVGGGEEHNNLKKLSEALNLQDKIIFTGKVDEQEKLNWLQQAWVFVNPSMMEGWGITSIEANACGVPVVAANVAGLRESVQNPHTGYLVEHGNVEKFSQRISELIEDQNLWLNMRRDSLEWAQNFDWNKSSLKFLSLLQATAKPQSFAQPNQDVNNPADLEEKTSLVPHLLTEKYAQINPQILRRPGSLQMLFGALISAVKSKIKTKPFALPQTIGRYHLQKEILRNGNVKSTLIGVYESENKKYLIKSWQGSIKDLNYYYLVNEYLTNKVLFQKISGLPENSQLKLPQVMECIASSESLTVVFEYIEGTSLSLLPIDQQVQVWREVANTLKTISGQLTDSEKNYFRTRTPLNYLAFLPFLTATLLFFSPKNYKTILRSLRNCLNNTQSLRRFSLTLAHRDLLLSNIMVSDQNIYLLDCENMALTVEGYDFAFMSVQPRHQNLANVLVRDFFHLNTIFLQNYICIHHAVGSGNFFKLNPAYLHKLYELES
jgi:cellulose synthase/poly-beta-1,6-N-acetylglucosamine synthase-like glycosyltransferase/glycosyltransferase involved in cell wall biosynthesis/O-antigen/teichoic acid export membrane protein